MSNTIKYYMLDSLGRLNEVIEQKDKEPVPSRRFTLISPPDTNKYRYFDFSSQAWVISDSEPAQWVDEHRRKLYSMLSEKRYQAEISGISLPDGASIATDRESQAKVASAFVSLQAGLISSTAWKTGTGAWVELDKNSIAVVSAAVSKYVADCYAAERSHYLAIESLTTIDQLLSYCIDDNWPTREVLV